MPKPTPGGLTPSLVSNIPVKEQQPGAPAFNDEAELDEIMQDVGRQLKKEDNVPRKKGFLGFGRKTKTEPKLTQPPSLNRAQPMPVAATTPEPALQTAKAPAQPAPKTQPAKTNSVPVLVVTLTVIITAALIAAAIYTYKK